MLGISMYGRISFYFESVRKIEILTHKRPVFTENWPHRTPYLITRQQSIVYFISFERTHKIVSSKTHSFLYKKYRWLKYVRSKIIVKPLSWWNLILKEIIFLVLSANTSWKQTRRRPNQEFARICYDTRRPLTF